MRHKFSRYFAFCAITTFLAGCQGLAGLATSENIKKGVELIKELGLEFKYTDADGKEVSLSTNDDIEEVNLEGKGKLKKGDDYDVKDGKLVFKNLTPEEQKKVDIKLKGGVEFKEVALDTRKDKLNTNRACFAVDNGELGGTAPRFNQVDGSKDCNSGFKEHQQRLDGARATVKTGLSFKGTDVKFFGLKHQAGSGAFSFPNHEWVAEDGGTLKIAPHIMIGPPNQDMKARVYLIGYTKATGIAVAKFNLTKDLDRPAPPAPPKPGEPFRPIEFKAITLEVDKEIKVTTTDYKDEGEAKLKEGLQNIAHQLPGKPGQQVFQPPPGGQIGQPGSSQPGQPAPLPAPPAK